MLGSVQSDSPSVGSSVSFFQGREQRDLVPRRPSSLSSGDPINKVSSDQGGISEQDLTLGLNSVPVDAIGHPSPLSVLINPEAQTRSFRIVAALWPLPPQLGWFAPFGHDFLLLCPHDRDEPVAAIHGLCTSRRTGEKLPFGGWDKDHTLKIHHCVYDKNFAEKNSFPMDRFKLSPPLRTKTIDKGSNALARWIDVVMNELPKLNALDRDYLLFGLGINSNSVYWTLCKKMGIEPPLFGWPFQPGYGWEMMSSTSTQPTLEEGKASSLSAPSVEVRRYV